MVGIDEIRKAKGLEPIFIPKIADLILPSSEAEKQLKQMRFDEAYMHNNFR